MQKIARFIQNRVAQLGVFIVVVFFNVTLLVVTWPYIKTHVLHWEQGEAYRKEGPKNVEVTKVLRRSITKRITVNGVVRSKDSVEITSEISGRVRSLHFQEGDFVKQGQLLIQLDDQQARAELQEAQAHEKQTNAVHLRKQQLYAQKNVQTGRSYGSKAEAEEAEARWEMAKAAVQKAQVQVQRTRIVSPQDGRIGLSELSVGSTVHQGQIITRVVRPDVFTVDLSVSESDAAFMKPGQEAYVTLDENDVPRSALVEAIEPYSDPISHMTRVRAVMQNSEPGVRDGVFVRVAIPLSKVEDALVVPQICVVKENGQDVVYLAAHGKAVMIPVTVGIKEDTFLQILDGVSEGDLVITDSPEHMMNNMSIRIEREE